MGGPLFPIKVFIWQGTSWLAHQSAADGDARQGRQHPDDARQQRHHHQDLQVLTKLRSGRVTTNDTREQVSKRI